MGNVYKINLIDRFLLFIAILLLFSSYYSLRPSKELISLPIDGPRLYFLFLFIVLTVRNKMNIFKILFNNTSTMFLYLIFLLVYAFVGFLFSESVSISNDYGFLMYALNFFLFSYLTSVMTALYFKQSALFLKYFYRIVLTQAVFILITYIFPETREYIKFIIYIPDDVNIDFLNAIRAPGLTVSSGAFLSFLQSLGVAAKLLLKQRNNENLNKYDYIGILIIFLSCFASARTGFIVIFLLLCFYMLQNTNFKQLFYGLTISSLLLLGFSTFLINTLEENPQINWYLNVYFNFINDFDNSSAGNLVGMELPAMTVSEYMFGTHQQLMGHDSGYVKTYFSLGIVIALLTYGMLFIYLIGPCIKEMLFEKGTTLQQKKFDLLYLFTVLVIFIFETKEPFIWKGILFLCMTVRCWWNEEVAVRIGKDIS